tara:strand:- start:10167 stop:10679 length:513 start_codon:yes stop_codon:yes gene_type:complete
MPPKNTTQKKSRISISPIPARASPTNTMFALMPHNQSYKSMRKERKEQESLNIRERELTNTIIQELKKIQKIQNKIVDAEKNKGQVVANMKSKNYDEDDDDDDDDDEISGINNTWRTCDGDNIQKLRKSPTMNFKKASGGKKCKKKTCKHNKKNKSNKRIPYKRKSIKYK